MIGRDYIPTAEGPRHRILHQFRSIQSVVRLVRQIRTPAPAIWSEVFILQSSPQWAPVLPLRSAIGPEETLEKSRPTAPEMAAKVKTFKMLWIEMFIVIVTL